MGGALGPGGRLPAYYFAPAVSSFTEFLSMAAPDLLPGRRPLPPGSAAGPAGGISSYAGTGGGYEEHGYCGVGSGSSSARSALRRPWRPRLGADDVVRMIVDSLYDAADEDSATGGPDMTRRLYPMVMI